MIYCYNETEKPKYCQQYLVIFPVIYSLHIQIKSDMSLKKKKLRVTAVFKVPYATTLAVVLLDVVGETFNFHPALYM